MNAADTIRVYSDTTVILNSHNSFSIQLPKQPQEQSRFNVKDYMPVMIFLSGLLLSYVVRKINLWRANYKLKKFIIDWIELINTPLQKQVKVFGDLANLEYSIDSFSENPIVHHSHNLHADKLKSINTIDMKVLIMDNLYGKHRKKAALLYKLSSYIDFLFTIETEIAEFILGSKNSIRKLNENWNEAILDFEGKLDSMLLEDVNNIDRDNFLKLLFPIQQNWKKSTMANRKVFIRSNVTEPIYLICLKHMHTNNFLDKRPLPLMKAIDRLNISFKEYEVFTAYISQRMKHYEISYKHCGKGLMLSKNRLDRMWLNIICK